MSEAIEKLITNLNFNLTALYRFKTAKGDNRRCVIGAFNGNISMTVWDGDNRGGGPALSTTLDRVVTDMFASVMKKLLGSQPNTTIPIEKQMWVKSDDGKGGKFIKDIIFKFTKNDKQTYTLEIVSQKMNTPLVLIFKSSSGLILGGDTFSESEQSAIDFKSCIKFFESEVGFARILSLYNNKKREFNRNGGNGSRQSAPPNSGHSDYSRDGDAY